MCFVCFLSTEQVASSCRSLAARGISAQSLEGGLQSMQAGQGWARQAQWRSVDKWWPGSVQTTCVHPVGCWMWGERGWPVGTPGPWKVSQAQGRDADSYWLDGVPNPCCAQSPKIQNILVEKLDGVGPVDNRPSTDYLYHFNNFFYLFFFYIWHVTCDMWHVTCETWHVTCDTWHIGHGEHCVKISGP